MIAVGIVYVPQYARLARSSVLAVKENEYIEAARAIGVPTPVILARHVLPNILAPLLVQATLGVATAELEAAGLSYLGLGARPPTPEWGAMAQRRPRLLGLRAVGVDLSRPFDHDARARVQPSR